MCNVTKLDEINLKFNKKLNEINSKFNKKDELMLISVMYESTWNFLNIRDQIKEIKR
jgi:hypothetical protein